LQSYRFYLYQDDSLLGYSPELFNGLLEYEFTGFQNDETYEIELKVVSVDGLEQSLKLSFVAKYIQPRLANVINLENNAENGSIKITAKVKQIIGQIDSGTINYIDNDWIDLHSGIVSFSNDDGFKINTEDFSIKMWIKDIKVDEYFLTMDGQYGSIKMNYYNNRIHVWKEMNGIKNHFASDEIYITSSNDVVFIFIQSVENGIEIKSQIIM
jgi:hypothetical protein